jgi:hypothetical protein
MQVEALVLQPAVNSEIIKQVTSSWSIFIQLLYSKGDNSAAQQWHYTYFDRYK